MKKKWNFMIDQGGTFTDIIAIDPDNKIITEKILSKKPEKQYNPVLTGVNMIINSSKNFSKHQIKNIKIGTNNLLSEDMHIYSTRIAYLLRRTECDENNQQYIQA